jgi:hypothetical protein
MRDIYTHALLPVRKKLEGQPNLGWASEPPLLADFTHSLNERKLLLPGFGAAPPMTDPSVLEIESKDYHLEAVVEEPIAGLRVVHSAVHHGFCPVPPRFGLPLVLAADNGFCDLISDGAYEHQQDYGTPPSS